MKREDNVIFDHWIGTINEVADKLTPVIYKLIVSDINAPQYCPFVRGI